MVLNFSRRRVVTLRESFTFGCVILRNCMASLTYYMYKALERI
jgi:hypothetical protein